MWVNKQRKVGGGGLLEVMQEKAIRIQQRNIWFQGKEMFAVMKINKRGRGECVKAAGRIKSHSSGSNKCNGEKMRMNTNAISKCL